MVDVNQIMYDMIKKCNCIETSSVNEIEEVIDTGLEKNEENIQKVALEYLDEKGYARRVDNLDRAKQHIIESSLFSDTVKVRKKREMVEDLLSESDEADLQKLTNICMLDNLLKMNEKLDKIANPRYEYAVEVVDSIMLDSEKPTGTLQEFESFSMLLNRYANAGWQVKSITTRETQNHKLSMTGFSSQIKQYVIVFERQK